VKKIKLLQVASGLNFGGYERVISNLCENIDPHEFEVSVICTKFLGHFGAQLRESGFDVSSFEDETEGVAGRFVPAYVFGQLKRGEYDIVHTHGTSALLDVAPIAPLFPRTKFVHTFHYGNYPHRPMKYLLLEALFSRFADELVAVSHFQRDAILEVFRLADNRIRTIWNGVNIESSTADENEMLRDLGIGSGKIVVGTIANVIEQKGYEHFLEVASIVCAEIPNVVFVSVGGGALQDEIRAAARESLFADRLFFLGYRSDATEILGIFDVFILTSLWEAMPIVLLEAMAYSKPIVATNVGDNSRMVVNGLNGYITEPKDIQSMSKRLLRLVQDSEQRRQMGNAGFERYRDNFTAEVMVSRYQDLYRSLIS
jgi:glycosyltransferase involved in cell wall biosynthesis